MNFRGGTYGKNGADMYYQSDQFYSRPALMKIILLLALLLFPLLGQAGRIDEMDLPAFSEQAATFFRLEEPVVRATLLGAVLLGISGGILGSFLVVRQLALFGDTLSHAILPGVAAGYLWHMSKDPLALVIGAVMAGMLGTLGVWLLRRTTLLKEDAAMAMVLSGFYGLGVCLLSMLQNLPGGNRAGLDKIFFGQMAALSPNDLWLLGVMAVLNMLFFGLLYKENLTIGFDAAFARLCGTGVRTLQAVFFLLLTATIVAALQAVGVVLVTAILIIPAATARLLTDRLHRMIGVAIALAVFSGAVGAFVSYLRPGLPTGPLVVLGAGVWFLGALFFAPHTGLLSHWWKHRRQYARVQRENTLKAVWRYKKHLGQGIDTTFFDREFAAFRGLMPGQTTSQLRGLCRAGLVQARGKGIFQLSSKGGERARELIRNHRIWEVYLTKSAGFAPDHVHADAEIMEHLLSNQEAAAIALELDDPQSDPHGQEIPRQR